MQSLKPHQLFALSVGVLLLAGMAGCQGIQFEAGAPAAIEWIIGLDTSTSVQLERFLKLRDETIPQVVLCRLKSGDRCHILAVDDDPEDDAEFKLVRGGRTGIDEAVSEVQSLIAGIQQQKEKKGTNLGGVLAYTKKIARWMAQDRQVLRSRHRPLRKEPHFVVNVFTDGHPDRWQTEDVGEIPVSHLTVWFWGVDDEKAGQRLIGLGTRMGLRPEQMHVVPFGYWENRAAALEDLWDRRQDRKLLEVLRTGRPAGKVGL